MYPYERIFSQTCSICSLVAPGFMEMIMVEAPQNKKAHILEAGCGPFKEVLTQLLRAHGASNRAKEVPKKCIQVPTGNLSLERSLGARDLDILLADTAGYLTLKCLVVKQKLLPRLSQLGYHAERISLRANLPRCQEAKSTVVRARHRLRALGKRP